MLPFLPALLLLLLQGPSDFERLAVEGRSKADWEARLAPRERAILHTLLAARSPELSCALASFLTEPGAKVEPFSAPSVKSLAPKVQPNPGSAPCEGFADCRRSRDGP